MLKQLLKSQNKTQKDIACNLNVTQSLVSQWCTGKCQPNISQLRPLCRILKVDIYTIIDCFDNKN